MGFFLAKNGGAKLCFLHEAGQLPPLAPLTPPVGVLKIESAAHLLERAFVVLSIICTCGSIATYLNGSAASSH